MARRNKYGAIKTKVDDITFHSKKEAARYVVLRDMLRDGLITDLRLQVPYKIVINDILIARWYADFVYFNSEGVETVEDVKSLATVKSPVYRIKKKCVEALYGIRIFENI